MVNELLEPVATVVLVVVSSESDVQRWSAPRTNAILANVARDREPRMDPNGSLRSQCGGGVVTFQRLYQRLVFTSE